MQICDALSFISAVDSILLLGINMPTFVREGADANLTCVYDLEGVGLYR